MSIHFLTTIHRVLHERAENTAFVIDGKSYSYRELRSRIGSILRCVKGARNENSVIGVATHDSLDTYASLLACWFAGKGYVPINPELPHERNLTIIEQSGITLLLTDGQDARIEKITAQLPELRCIQTDAAEKNDFAIELISIQETSIAYILFTSGSTGVPKGVPITFVNLQAFLDAFNALGFSLSHADRFLQMFDLTFDLSVLSTVIPLALGASMHTIPPEQIKYMYIAGLLEDYQITFALMVPSILSYLRPYFDEFSFPSLRYSLFCGEALYEDVIAEWSRCIPNAEIHNVYGPTEATVICTAHRWQAEHSASESYNGIISIGKPMLSTQLCLVDDALRLTAEGEKGELCLTGPQVTEGYWKNPERNLLAFFKMILNGKEHIFYRTGDICFFDKSGNYFYCGRVDHQVKIQGYRVELSEVEHHAREVAPGCNLAAVIRPDPAGNNEIFLFIEKYTGTKEELTEQLKKHLPYYMMPNGIKILASFPLNSNGKIDRKRLREELLGAAK